MSESAEGPGWWQASDGKWYPPEQAPGYQQPGSAPVGGGGGAAGLDLGSALGYGWNKFVQNIGEWIIIWLVLVGVIILSVIVAGVVLAGSIATGGVGFRFVYLFIQIFFGAVQGVVYIAVAKAALASARGETPDVGTAFKLSGNNIVAGVIFGVAIAVVTWLTSWICLGFFSSIVSLVVYMLLGTFPIISADQDRGADALSEAVNLHTSNFGVFGVYWLIGGLITAFTCGLGGPVAMIGGVYLYKLNRGEAVAPAGG